MNKKTSRLSYSLMLACTMALATPMAMASAEAAPQSKTQPQHKGISGQVFDELGEPIIGASILVEGTTLGTVTDIDGNFEISNAAPGSKIQVSFVGYTTKHLTAAPAKMSIVLEPDDQILDETVVIGYGVQKKSNVTGAIASLKSEDFENSINTNAASALQGKVSGVQVVNNSGQPGAAPAIRVRGYSSNGSSDPLYIVDGLKVSDISYLEPSSIQSMEVLKDAASAAIYGAEAGNGVVLITTKGGQKGKTKITFDGAWTFSNLANKVDLMNASQYKNFYSEALGSGFDQLYDQYYDGKTDTDWQDAMYEQGVMQKYNVSASAGNDNGQFFLGLGYMDNDGIMVTNQDSYQRITGQINASYKIRKWLEVSTNNTITQTNSHTVSESNVQYGLMQNVMWMDPLTPQTYSSLSSAPTYVQNAVANGYRTVMDGDKYVGVSFLDNDSPYSAILRSKTGTESFYLNGMTSVNLNPFKGFTFTSRLGYTLGHKDDDNYGLGYWTTWDQTGNSQNNFQSQISSYRYYQWENFMNYMLETKIGNFGIMAGMSWSDSKINYVKGTTDKLSSDESNFRYLTYSTGDATDFVSGNPTFKRQIAYYGRLSWDWLNRYNAQFNFRADSYDAAYLDLDHNWGYFPSVSIGWTFSNEEFFKPVIDSNIITFGKIRASYGVNGSISNLGGYAYAATLNSGSTDGVTQTAYWLNGQLVTGTYPGSTLANPKLRWERSKQYDLGLDLRFFRDRLTFTYDYYNKTTDGLIVKSVAPLVTGSSSVYQNLGIVKNSGHEFELEWRDQTENGFGYSIKASLSTVDNKVSEYKGEGVRIEGTRLASSSRYLTYFEEGYPLWYIRGFQLEGVNKETGEAIYRDIDGDGAITDEDRTCLGSGIPDFTYGLTLGFDYKGFDLQVYGAGSKGNKLVYGVVSVSEENKGNLPLFLYENRWTSSNTSASMPSAQHMRDDKFFNSDQFVFDASFFKIKQIQLGYTLPKKALTAMHLQNLRAYVSLDNFFTFTDYPGQDPEVNASGNTDANGYSAMAIDFAGYPIAKSLSFGLNVAF